MLWFLLHDWQVHAYWWSHLFVVWLVSARRSVYTGTWTACKHAEFQLVWNSLHARHSCTMNAEHPTACLYDVDIHACQCKHRITATFAEVCALCGCSWLTLQCYMLCAFIRKMFCAVLTKTWTVIVLSLAYPAHRITTFRLYKWPLISSLMTIERLYTDRFFQVRSVFVVGF